MEKLLLLLLLLMCKQRSRCSDAAGLSLSFAGCRVVA
jgi:hypothetical protein